MTGSSEDRARDLYSEGARILAALWDDAVAMVRLREAPDYHDPRGTLAYARVLAREGDAGRAARAIGSVLALQETRPQDAHYGNFRWLLEQPCVTDLNGVEFMLDEIITLLREHAASLPGDLAGEMRRAVALGLAEIDRLDVHPSYTNIALSDIANSVLGGELLGDTRYIERGARRLDEWLAFTNASGAPHEFNSATYTAVDIGRLAALAEHTRDPRVALKARIAEERIWLHVAAHYHPALAQLAGAHSRSYYDGWSGAGGYLKLLLWRLLGDGALRRETPYAPRSREEGHVGVALETVHCPDYVERWLRDKRFPFEARETADAEHGVDIATYMTESYTLGTASRSYGVGEPPEPWPAFDSLHMFVRRVAAPGYSAVYVRYVVDDKAPGAAGYSADDHWDEGQHVAAQHRKRAVVAYGLMPRLRPAHSCKLSVRMLGLTDTDEVWIADGRVAAWPERIEPGQRVVIAIGNAYLALIPLEQTDIGSDAPIELNLSGGVLTLDIYNYRGPAKTFWEQRSQRGPFYKGNVRNAFVIEAAERTEFADVAAFRDHIARATVTDAADDKQHRRIAYASDGGSVALTYSLWDMSIIERRCDGAVYEPPMACAGATDGGGAQLMVSRDTDVGLGRARLRSGPAPTWLIADDTVGRYVFVNPGDTAMPVRLATPNTTVECDAFGCGRLDIDEAAGIVRVEAANDPGALRIDARAGSRLIVSCPDANGAWVVRERDIAGPAGG
jgi:hypothetical protein